MPFLAGSLAFERFRVTGFEAEEFTQEHIDVLTQYASGQFELSSEETVQVGFLGGSHVLDQSFDLGKNVVNDSLHFSVRIDTNQIPASLKKAWTQMELAARAGDNPSGRPSKAQRQEAKEAVEHRCQMEAETGKYRKMQHFPLLWDLQNQMLYFGGSGTAAIGHCADLLERAFGIELHRVTASTLALDWATENKEFAALDDLTPAQFIADQARTDVAWVGADANNRDYLGNEFMLWLWAKLANETDTLTLVDDSEVTVMLAKTLTLECPLGESGKETISAESPVQLPEALRALQSGKLPRKAGMTLVRHGTQYDLVLQAESFSVSGAKIHIDEDADAHDLDARIESIRELNGTIDLLFHSFCQQRVLSKNWKQQLASIQTWLASDIAAATRKQIAAA